MAFFYYQFAFLGLSHRSLTFLLLLFKIFDLGMTFSRSAAVAAATNSSVLTPKLDTASRIWRYSMVTAGREGRSEGGRVGSNRECGSQTDKQDHNHFPLLIFRGPL